MIEKIKFAEGKFNSDRGTQDDEQIFSKACNY